jgi:hypothetical protein
MPVARFIVCFALLLLGGGAFAEEAHNRVALVIGNSAYARAPLANPVNDARLIAAKLKAQGFEAFELYDAGQKDMKRAVQTFAATLRQRGKDVAAFIFYAGHGVQVKGENYLIPVDARIESEGDVDIDAVSLSSIMSMLENTETRLAVVVLDACRNNPFGYARGSLRGLARVDAPSGSLVAFSTAPGKAAPDGPAGGNSYYTAALAQAMAEPGLKIEEVFKKVRVAVREQTKGEQTPWESTSLTGDFYPAGRAGTLVAPEEIEQPQQVAIDALSRIKQFITEEHLKNREHYADQVDYFDKGLVSREVAIMHKQKYAQKWPIREYTLVPGTLRVSSDRDRRYVAVFSYEFHVANSQKEINGRGSSQVSLVYINGQFFVTSIKEIVDTKR